MTAPPLQLSNPDARVFFPDGVDGSQGLERITHLGVGAHQDDLEFMAIHGILKCFHDPERWFGGVICSDGAGSARQGAYADFTDAEMRSLRIEEQERAALMGGYGAIIQLAHPSSQLKDKSDSSAVDDLSSILAACGPEVVYTHQPADKHATHIAVMVRLITALRQLPAADRPKKVFGCEVWRGLDWVADDQKIALDVSGNDQLTEELNRIFASQIVGGKRYDLAVEGRKRANATFCDPQATDRSEKSLVCPRPHSAHHRPEPFNHRVHRPLSQSLHFRRP